MFPSWIRSRPLFFLGLASLLLIMVMYLPHLASIPLSGEEPKRAVISHAMLESGDFMLPHFGGEIYMAKPPGYNWFICFMAVLSGGEVTDFNARASSVVAMVLLVWFLLFAMCEFLSPVGQGALALGAALSPYMVHKGTLAEIDMLFTLVVTVSLWSWFLLDEAGKRGLRLWAPPTLIAALGFLVKREPGLIFFYLGVYGFLAYRRRFRDVFSLSQFAGMGLALACIGLWMGYVARQTSVAFVWGHYFREAAHHVRKADMGLWDQLLRAVGYPLEVWATMLPFSLFLVPLVFSSVRHRLRERYGDAFTFALVVVLLNFPVYWVLTREPRYFMPMFPTLFILSAMVVDAYVQEPDGMGARARALLAMLTRGLTLLLGVVALLLVVAVLLPLVREMPEPWLEPLATVLAAVIFSMVARWAWRAGDTGRVCFVALAALLLAMRVLQFAVILPHQEERVLTKKNGRASAEALLQQLPEGTERVLVFGIPLPNPVYYYARQVNLSNIWFAPENIKDANWLVAREEYVARLEKSGARLLERGGFSYRSTKMRIYELTP